MTGLLTAGTGQSWENELVAALDKPGSAMTVVRRCVDVADVLAEAGTGLAAAVVVAADLRRMDSDAVARLRSAGLAVVAVYPAADAEAAARLDRIGIPFAVADDAGAAAVLAAVRAALLDLPSRPPTAGGPPAPGSAAREQLIVSDPRRALGPGPAGPPVVDPTREPPPRGRVIAVWGGTGAPGRTTVAAGLAVAVAAMGVPTLLVDADVYGGVLASAFGLLDESPGLAGACRQAANGRLNPTELTRLVWAIGPNLKMLTGITRADRWPELRPSAIPAVLAMARSMASVVVVDCGFALEADEEITFDTVAPRRNGATLAVLADADLVLAVGSADPPGLERLIRGLADLSDRLPGAAPRVVLNRIRRSAAGADEAAAAVARFAGAPVIAALPEDRSATDRAWQRGESLRQVAPTSPLVKAVDRLAAGLIGPTAPAPPASRRRRHTAAPV